jgi:hypothetical protein
MMISGSPSRLFSAATWRAALRMAALAALASGESFGADAGLADFGADFFIGGRVENVWL